MAKAKKMDKSAFENIVKELSSQAEMIKTKQHAKQTIMDTFDKEVQSYRSGKISKKAVRASVPRVNRELREFDGEIVRHIGSVRKAARKVTGFAGRQKPKKFKATVVGMRSAAVKKKARKRARKRKK